MQNWKTERPLLLVLIFTALAYGWSWFCWWPILDDIKPNLLSMDPIAIMRMLAGGFGPSAAAILLSLLTGGPREAGALLSRLVRWKVGAVWYLLAVLFAPVVILGGVGIYAALGHDVGAIRWDHWWIIAAFYGVALFLGPLLEETGWRGFAQPVLFNRYGIFVTGAIVGTIWTYWHAPLWLAKDGSSLSGGDFTAIGLACYWLFLVGQSIFVAWLLSKARGSVLIAMLVHQGMNAGAIGWLFYDIAVGDKSLAFEQLPVVAIWAVIGLGLVFGAMRGRVSPDTAA
ncbi:CAAX amino terminal protease family protein [Asticcacaulis biprosthecium C19]|uniref:CAAX amino terminal protease family protein n=1 Tax=Asticcacaulis biprosthecium C19 TaxID=715226 RepID=F4QNT2_9CAUL|nr:type II CAAX endopeptidase family protein [Asticcacaulis biprosthecium]EGF90990.1 CAAX amino terminal protease family protein [Asticcacaulis biprosthecium C19]